QTAVGQAQGLGVFVGRRADPAVPIGETGRAGPHDADAHAALRGFGKVVGDLVFTLCADAHAGAPQEIPHAAGERVGVAGDVVGISARVFGGESVGSDQIRPGGSFDAALDAVAPDHDHFADGPAAPGAVGTAAVAHPVGRPDAPHLDGFPIAL